MPVRAEGAARAAGRGGRRRAMVRMELLTATRARRLPRNIRQSHLPGVLSARNVEASPTPIVPVQKALFASTRPNAHLITPWIEAWSRNCVMHLCALRKRHAKAHGTY